MRRVNAFVVVTGIAAAAAASSIAAPLNYIVHGSVGPGATIALRDGLGNPYTTGRQGMYRITVTDRSPSDGFHLVGPGVSVVITGVRFVGVRTVGVTLRPGTYRYRSDAHPRSLSKTFVLKP